jgi:mRNA interferase HigB
MNVITRKRIRDFMARHPDAGAALEGWYRIARKAKWRNLQEVRMIYPHADLAGVASGNKVTIFNIAGNKYRLIAAIHYKAQRLYVLRLLTHAEYDKNAWKKTL